MSDAPRGILRNKKEVSESDHVLAEQLDRQEVIRNTQLNAKLSAEYSSEGDKIRAKIAEKKKHDHSGGSSDHESEPELHEHLKWDELNLYKTEQEKSSTMKIDEPKTPYEGGFNPSGEYYRDDDEDTQTKDIPDFELGESEFDNLTEKPKIESLHGGEVIKNEEDDENDEDEEEEDEAPPLTAEERHKKFEEMRKAHYHMKGEALHHVNLNEIEDDN
ncbi:uncharacterized protein RJT21DRAFT_40625 [Scheffersomyces amazonensis]|uniref:uncharacterized protein n=1 Tax=Scheffersomyces amazonensis TaxID=1078765 RepID=UPI00315DA4B8